MIYGNIHQIFTKGDEMEYEVWFYKGNKKITEKTYKARDYQSLMFKILSEKINADNYFITKRR